MQILKPHSKIPRIGKKPTGYKKTGNLAVDMVAACIDHYHRHGKRLSYIRLEASKWHLFKAYVLDGIPGYDFSDGYVDFDGVQITEGSSLQVTAMYHEFAPDKPLEDVN